VVVLDRDDLQQTNELLAILERSPARRCFASIYVRSANIAVADDVYGEGTLAQFYGVWQNRSLLSRRTSFLLWMEPGK
jgi:hypothetical protein